MLTCSQNVFCILNTIFTCTQFGLKLGTTKRGPPQMQVESLLPAANSRPRRDSADELMGPPGSMDSGKRSIEAVMATKREDRPRDLFFAIPRSCVGGIIGRGGQFIRDLQTEFGVKVYVEKEEYGSQRICNLSFMGFGRERRDSRDGGPSSGGRASIGEDASERDRHRDRDNREEEETNKGQDAAPKKTVKRAAAGSGDEDGEGGCAETADVAAHKRNRRDDSAREEPVEHVDAQERTVPLEDAEREGEEGARHSTTSPAPKRKGYGLAEPSEGDEKSAHTSHKHIHGETADGSDVSGGEEEEEGRHKRQRGSGNGGGDGSSLVVAKAASPVNPMRSLQLCKERIEAMIEDLLQHQAADPASIAK